MKEWADKIKTQDRCLFATNENVCHNVGEKTSLNESVIIRDK